jgi:tetratricopeptide (TPR) repeat protein
MTEDLRLSKVSILIQQKKFAEAEKILKDLLSADATDIHQLSLLAEVNLQQDKLDVAGKIIDSAIGIAPDAPHLFYMKARIAIQQDDYQLAEKYTMQAIGLDPYDADYFAFLANINLARKQYETALENADTALGIDPENLLGLNTRGKALLKLNKPAESFASIEGALREDPNNAYTHANYGWNLLEKGDHKKALVHFRESLKNDPGSEYAQAGMIEAIKASSPLYRLFLRYAFWMNNLTSKYQWGVIIGFYIAVRVLRSIATANESLQPFLNPLIMGLAIIAFSTWVITPISNLFLRFNQFGYLLLDRKEKISANFVAGGLATFAIGMLLYFAMTDERFLAVAVFGFAMMLPFSVMFSPSKYKNALLIYAIAMTVMGLAAIAQTFSTGELFNSLTTVFLVGFIGFQWVANFLLISQDNR